MKYIKILLIVMAVGTLSSCLKSKNDFAGIRLDDGNIVTSIGEAQYINVDGQNLGCGFQMFTYFNFSNRPNENVKFFTLHIGQPRNKKIAGSLRVGIYRSDVAGKTSLPAGAINVSTDPNNPTYINVPASSASSIDYDVKFAVDKTTLDVAEYYGVNFTIVSVNQGAYSELDKSVDIIINNGDLFDSTPNNESDISGGYVWEYTLRDDANQLIANNKKDVVLSGELGFPDYFTLDDVLASCALAGNHHVYANNTVTGANVALFIPEYEMDASQKVTNIASLGAGSAGFTVSSIVVDPAGTTAFNYVSHNRKSMTVKYSFTVTSVINGVTTPRNCTVVEKFTFNNKVQAYYEN